MEDWKVQGETGLVVGGTEMHSGELVHTSNVQYVLFVYQVVCSVSTVE
jgi:hypothetical protein